MLIRDVEMFIEHCENKGLAAKTIGSYEQTLRLLMLYLDEQGITQTEKITHTVIQNYVKQIKERGQVYCHKQPEQRELSGAAVRFWQESVRCDNQQLSAEHERLLSVGVWKKI